MNERQPQSTPLRCFPYTVPNILSLARICLAPLMIVSALFDTRELFLVVFAVCLSTDALDGFLARILKQRSLLGARLDTLGDITMYASAAIGAWFLWSEMLRTFSTAILITLSVMISSGVLSAIKHGRLPSYHSWCARTASAALGIFSFIMLIGISDIPFTIALVLVCIATVEEMIITVILPEPTTNVRSIYHALQERRRLKADT